MSSTDTLPMFVTSSIFGLSSTHNTTTTDSINNMAAADSLDYGATFIVETNSSDNASLANGTGFPGYHQPGVVIQILARFHLIALPTVAVLGIISNMLSFFIFVSKTMRRTSCSIYLAARSVSDTGFLLSLFFTWLGDAMGVPVIHTVVVCQVSVCLFVCVCVLSLIHI